MRPLLAILDRPEKVLLLRDVRRVLLANVGKPQYGPAWCDCSGASHMLLSPPPQMLLQPVPTFLSWQERGGPHRSGQV